MTQRKSNQNDTMADKLAKGAAITAVAAGVVAAGAALSRPKNREKLMKGASDAVGGIRDGAAAMTEEMGHQYQAVAQQVRKQPAKRQSQPRKVAGAAKKQEK